MSAADVGGRPHSGTGLQELAGRCGPGSSPGQRCQAQARLTGRRGSWGVRRELSGYRMDFFQDVWKESWF